MTRTEKDLVNNLLIPMMYRLGNNVNVGDSVHAMRYAINQGTTFPELGPPEIPSAFNNIRHAEECHGEFLRWTFGLLQTADDTPSGHIFPVGSESLIETTSSRFLQAIDGFIIRFEGTPNALAGSFASILGAAGALKLVHYWARICIKALNFNTETAYDSLEPDFANLISCCEYHLSKTTHKHHSLGTTKLFFGSDHSIVIPLFLTSLSTRNPFLRRRAINLLKRSAIAEGILGGGTSAFLATAVLKLEESVPNLVGVVTRASQIPESNRFRIHDVSLFTYRTSHLVIRLRMTKSPFPISPSSPDNLATKTIWLTSPRERPTSTSGTSPSPSTRAPLDHPPQPLEQTILSTTDSFTPSKIEDMIAADIREGVFPDLTISHSHLAWLDRSQTPTGGMRVGLGIGEVKDSEGRGIMGYRFLESLHPLVQRGVLRY